MLDDCKGKFKFNVNAINIMGGWCGQSLDYRQPQTLIWQLNIHVIPNNLEQNQALSLPGYVKYEEQEQL